MCSVALVVVAVGVGCEGEDVGVCEEREVFILSFIAVNRAASSK